MDREIGKLEQGFSDIKDTLADQNDVLKDIYEQAKKTNGRVSKLEFWRSAIIWGSGALWGACLFLSPYIVSYISERISEDVEDSVENAIDKKLEEKFKDDALDERIRSVLDSYDYDAQFKN